MHKFVVGAAVCGVMGAALVIGLRSVSAVPQRQELTISGTVQRVWEDGFRLEADDRTLTVDTWDLCGDNTTQFVAADDTVTMTGEFDASEFDAFSLTDAEGEPVCR